MNDTNNKTVRKGHSFLIYLLSAFAVIIASAVVFAYLYYRTLDPAGRAGVRADSSKTLVQLVAVGVIGGFITWALSERSKEKDRELAQRQKESDERAAQLQRERDREESFNEFRRQAINRLVEGTNVVRRAPLFIESHRSKKTYGEQLRAILDAKLDFSLLVHELESFPKALPFEKISPEIRKMEEYLNCLITEWKEKYSEIPVPTEEGWPVIEKLPELKDLRLAEESSKFRLDYLMAYSNALRYIRESIFTPPESNKTP